MIEIMYSQFDVTTDLNRQTNFDVVRRCFALLYDICQTDGSKVADNFDLSRIHAYYCYGDDLVGARCSTRYGFPANRHWVECSNVYAVFEAPDRSNTSRQKGEGNFLVLAYDINYDYYVGALLEDSFVGGPDGAQDASYVVLGCYQFDFNPDRPSVLRGVCVDSPAESSHDNYIPNEVRFDRHHLRMDHGYRMLDTSQPVDFRYAGRGKTFPLTVT